MRLLLAGVAGFALAVVPALAAEHSVQATPDNKFSPASLEIRVGDSVAWTNAGGFHNVHFRDGFDQPAEPAATWSEPVGRTFAAAGTYKYWCEAHGGEDSGMAGTIVVKSDDTTGTTTTTTTTQTETTPSTTTTQTTTSGPQPPPVVSVKPLRSRFCVRPGHRCSSAGVYLRITSDSPHRAVARLRRHGRAFGSVAFDLPAGTKHVRFRRTRSGRRLTPGRYTLKLGTAPVIRFRIILR